VLRSKRNFFQSPSAAELEQLVTRVLDALERDGTVQQQCTACPHSSSESSMQCDLLSVLLSQKLPGCQHPISCLCVYNYNIIIRNSPHVTWVSQSAARENVEASVMAWFSVGNFIE